MCQAMDAFVRVYHANLEVAGLGDNPTCSLPLKKKSDLLETRRKAFQTLEFPIKDTLNVPTGMATYELYGVFIQLLRVELVD